jgi:hypothetical protein
MKHSVSSLSSVLRSGITAGYYNTEEISIDSPAISGRIGANDDAHKSKKEQHTKLSQRIQKNLNHE